MGDEVLRSWRPALGPLVCPVGGSSWPLAPTSTYYCHMGTHSSSTPRVVGEQAIEAVQPGPLYVTATPVSGRLDVLLFHDLPGHFSYRAIHDVVKTYVDMVRIRHIYDDDCSANRCYVIFAIAAEARAALDSHALALDVWYFWSSCWGSVLLQCGWFGLSLRSEHLQTCRWRSLSRGSPGPYPSVVRCLLLQRPGKLYPPNSSRSSAPFPGKNVRRYEKGLL